MCSALLARLWRGLLRWAFPSSRWGCLFLPAQRSTGGGPVPSVRLGEGRGAVT